MVTLENRSPTYFQVSQCFPMDLDADATAAAAADARCVHTLSVMWVNKNVVQEHTLQFPQKKFNLRVRRLLLKYKTYYPGLGYF